MAMQEAELGFCILMMYYIKYTIYLIVYINFYFLYWNKRVRLQLSGNRTRTHHVYRYLRT